MYKSPALSRQEAGIILLVVLVIVGLLIAAIGRVQESAARMTCTNNLKQLGIPMQNYIDVGDSLPALTDQGDGAPTGRGLPSLCASLMPFLE